MRSGWDSALAVWRFGRIEQGCGAELLDADL
jgi:hypothetical protein